MREGREIILTQEGYQKLQEELDYLVNQKRKEVAERIKASIDFGDLAENSEYNDAKEEQAFVEGRIAQLNELLSRAKIINQVHDPNCVSIGSYVTLRDLETNGTNEYLIVGSIEADPSNHKISNESPVGKAIIGKKVGEIVEVEVPEGKIAYQIIGIRE